MYTYICIYIHINICIIHTYELTKKKKNIFKKRQNSSYIIGSTRRPIDRIPTIRRTLISVTVKTNLNVAID